MRTDSTNTATRCLTCQAPAHAIRRAHLPRMTGTLDVVTIRCETGHVTTVPALLW
jgi:hypothetical protein